MKGTLLILGMLVVLAATETPVEGFVKGVKQAVALGIDKIFASARSRICADLEKIIGKTYQEIEGKEEPDLNDLIVTYKTKSFTHEYKISNAVESLHKARVFQTGKTLVLYVHALNKALFKPILQQIDEYFLKSDEAENVILVSVDCSPLLAWLFFRFTHFVTLIGIKLAELTLELKHRIEYPKIHVVGQGLLTHACGFMGKKMFAQTGKKIDHITGLDPSWPCSANVDNYYTLNKTDADYIDIIHSNDGVLGSTRPMGHADYFPNNGEWQPGCYSVLCNHIRSNFLFFESALMKHNFPAVRCDNWDAFKKGQCGNEISYMGDGSEPGTQGRFYLQTRGSSPFGKGYDGIKYEGLLEGAIKKVLGDNKSPA